MQEHGIAQTGPASEQTGQPTSELASELAQAYAAAHYFVTIGHREWLFCVGQEARDIERELDAASYLFVTAWNPPPEAASTDQNMAADQRLQSRLHEGGYRHHSSLGCNAQGGAVEYGWVVLDIGLEAADALAREFGQAGTLYWRRGEPVRLRMLWPRPANGGDGEFTDWA